MHSTTPKPQATTKPVLTILEDVTDADQFVVISGTQLISGFISKVEWAITHALHSLP